MSSRRRAHRARRSQPPAETGSSGNLALKIQAEMKARRAGSDKSPNPVPTSGGHTDLPAPTDLPIPKMAQADLPAPKNAAVANLPAPQPSKEKPKSHLRVVETAEELDRRAKAPAKKKPISAKGAKLEPGSGICDLPAPIDLPAPKGIFQKEERLPPGGRRGPDEEFESDSLEAELPAPRGSIPVKTAVKNYEMDEILADAIREFDKPSADQIARAREALTNWLATPGEIEAARRLAISRPRAMLASIFAVSAGLFASGWWLAEVYKSFV